MRFAWVYDQAWSKVDRASKILMSPFLAHNLNFCQNLWKQSVILWWVFCDLNIIRVQHILNKSGPKLEPLSTKTYGSTQFKLVVCAVLICQTSHWREIKWDCITVGHLDQLSFRPIRLGRSRESLALNARYANNGADIYLCIRSGASTCNLAVLSVLCAHTVRLILDRLKKR